MKPTWECDGVKLYLGKCESILPTFAAGAFHSCVTDPPYGIGVDVAMAKVAGTQYGKACAAKRNYESSGWDSKPLSALALAEIMRVSRWQVLFGGNYFNLPPSRCILVWDKLNGTNDYADCELAWTNLDKPVRRLQFMWNGMLRDEDVERIHPTQKPVGVMQWCLGHLPQPVTNVVEPYMGSGYFAGAVERIEAELNRCPLFQEPPAIQKSMFPQEAS